MTATSISPPYPIFTDTDGTPLESGYIYIGTANQNPEVNPIQVYWDSDATVPAAQPIRTLGGYPSRDGSPGRIYTNSDASITIRDKNGKYVQGSPTITESFGVLLTSAVLYVSDLTGLRALDVTAGQRIYMMYRTTDGDNGGGLFKDVDSGIPGTYVDDGGIVIVPSGGDGSTAHIREFNGYVMSSWYGDNVSSADNSSALTAAGQAANTYSTDVKLGPGIHLSGQITLYDGVKLIGDSTYGTSIKAINGLNDDLFKTDGFDSLTGTNKWLSADGVLQFVGVKDIRIDGNSANQTAGRGMSIYAKGLYFDNVIITDTFAEGLYTECGENASVSAWQTLPEGNSGLLQIIGCGGHGWHMRGPHDLYSMKLLSTLNGGDGLRVESSAGNYLAAADFNMIHCYANDAKGIHIIGSAVRAGILRSENSGEEGLYLNGADHCEFAVAHVFDSCKTSGSYQCVIDSTSQYNHINGLKIRRAGLSTVGGIYIDGDSNMVRGVLRGDVTGGGNSTGVGCDLASGASNNNLDLVVTEFSGTNGIGLRTGETSSILWNTIRATLTACDVLWENANSGVNNSYIITGSCSAAQTKFTGNGPNTGTNRELWNVTLRDSSPDIVVSEEHITGTVDLNSTTEQIITVNHNLVSTPSASDVQLSLSSTGTNTTYDIQYMKVQSVSSTQIECRVKLSVAAGVAQTGTLNIRVRI